MCSNKIRTSFVPTNTYRRIKKQTHLRREVTCWWTARELGEVAGAKEPKGVRRDADYSHPSFWPSPGMEMLGAVRRKRTENIS